MPFHAFKLQNVAECQQKVEDGPLTSPDSNIQKPTLKLFCKITKHEKLYVIIHTHAFFSLKNTSLRGFLYKNINKMKALLIF